MATPPRKPFARFAHDIVNSPFGGERSDDVGSLGNLQNQLIASGFLSRPFDTSSWSEEEMAKLERCLNAMLSKAADDLAHQTHLMSRYRNLANDFERMEAQASKDKQALAASERERELAKARADAASKELNNEVVRHNLSKEEVNKARLALQSVKSAAQHEVKRKENEISNTLARWQKVSSAPSSSIASIVLNPQDAIGRSGSSPISSRMSDARASSPETALLEQSLKDLDEMRCVVQDENLQLREMVGDVINEVQATLQTIGQTVPSLAEELEDDTVHTTNPHLALSPESLTNHLSKLFLNLRDAAVNAVESANAQREAEETAAILAEQENVQELEESLAAMQLDLDEARLQVNELQAVVQDMEEREEKRASNQQAGLDSEKAEIRRQRKELELERKKFTAAAARLSKERDELDKERLALLEEKRKRATREREMAEREASASYIPTSPPPQRKIKVIRADHPEPVRHAAPTSPSSSSHQAHPAAMPRSATSLGFRPKMASSSSLVSSSIQPTAGRTANSSHSGASSTVRASTTSSALKSILAAGSDTPPSTSAATSSHPTRVTLKARTAAPPQHQQGQQGSSREARGGATKPLDKRDSYRALGSGVSAKVDVKSLTSATTDRAPSSSHPSTTAALTARDRVQRAVQAAKARSVSSSATVSAE